MNESKFWMHVSCVASLLMASSWVACGSATESGIKRGGSIPNWGGRMVLAALSDACLAALVVSVTLMIWQSPAKSDRPDALTSSMVWEYRPTFSAQSGQMGFGTLPLFDDATKTLVGGINFSCFVEGRDPYIDVWAYKDQASFQKGEGRRWGEKSAAGYLRYQQDSMPISIEGGFIFIDVNARSEAIAKAIFDFGDDQRVERIVSIPDLATIKFTFVKTKHSSSAGKIYIDFDQMLALCLSTSPSR